MNRPSQSAKACFLPKVYKANVANMQQKIIAISLAVCDEFGQKDIITTSKH